MEGKSKVSIDLCGKYPVQSSSIGIKNWLECKVWVQSGNDNQGGYKGEFEVGDNVL